MLRIPSTWPAFQAVRTLEWRMNLISVSKTCLKVAFVHLKTANWFSWRVEFQRNFNGNPNCGVENLPCFFMFSLGALLHRHVGKGSSWRSCEHRTSHAINEITKPAVARSASQVHLSRSATKKHQAKPQKNQNANCGIKSHKNQKQKKHILKSHRAIFWNVCSPSLTVET